MSAWSNSTLLTGDLATAVNDLKQGDGGPILVHGSATLAQGLLEANLVDDLRLMVFPVLVGGGMKVFPTSLQKSVFTLSDSETVLPNVVALTYKGGPSGGTYLRLTALDLFDGSTWRISGPLSGGRCGVGRPCGMPPKWLPIVSIGR